MVWKWFGNGLITKLRGTASQNSTLASTWGTAFWSTPYQKWSAQSMVTECQLARWCASQGKGRNPCGAHGFQNESLNEIIHQYAIEPDASSAHEIHIIYCESKATNAYEKNCPVPRHMDPHSKLASKCQRLRLMNFGFSVKHYTSTYNSIY
jgi:hypothetical protein